MINKDMLSKHLHHHGHKISEEEMYDSYKIFFGTLVSGPRLKIINLLRNGEKNVSEIMDELNMNQTSVSHNLIRLKDCGFVNIEVKGKFRYYSLNKETITPLMKIIDEHMAENCVHILRTMRNIKFLKHSNYNNNLNKMKSIKGGKNEK